ncbi:Imm26 family immunity protein [Priestia taiwanensis]|uniref:Uncharacterized protein n=1 Tax=Priestia taiwanensis TaxID=1347902 RepID=A0A917EUC9_9BACI|nr:Imm26 family immunity protein [Priestia taiwanensis]MBM7365317.1 hypothetical protein [Priestia taiwanensis]GGE86107.1 hypothetical protein GCM10007140_39380 [Priestia taiwanensis]
MANENFSINETIIDKQMNVYKEMVSLYQSEYKRFPTIQEVEQILATALKYQQSIDFKGNEGIEIHDVKIKTTKAKKTQFFKPGDIVAIPLNHGEIYGYGMILSGGPKKQDEDTYIKFTNIFTKEILNIIEFRKKEYKELFLLNCAFGSITARIWKIIGEVPYNPQSFKIPNFLQTLSSTERWVIIGGDVGNKRYAEKKEISELNPFGIFGNGSIEVMLYERFLD